MISVTAISVGMRPVWCVACSCRSLLRLSCGERFTLTDGTHEDVCHGVFYVTDVAYNDAGRNAR